MTDDAERYWEGRWRDEAAENERLRLALQLTAQATSHHRADINEAIVRQLGRSIERNSRMVNALQAWRKIIEWQGDQDHLLKQIDTIITSNEETKPMTDTIRSRTILSLLQPFADFADPTRRMPRELVITKGSPWAKLQLTMGDCYDAADAVEAILQDAGKAAAELRIEAGLPPKPPTHHFLEAAPLITEKPKLDQ
jgi:hypothetical protein